MNEHRIIVFLFFFILWKYRHIYIWSNWEGRVGALSHVYRVTIAGCQIIRQKNTTRKSSPIVARQLYFCLFFFFYFFLYFSATKWYSPTSLFYIVSSIFSLVLLYIFFSMIFLTRLCNVLFINFFYLFFFS